MTPSVMMRVRNRPGVARLPLADDLAVEDQSRPGPGGPGPGCRGSARSKKIRPLTGESSTWVGRTPPEHRQLIPVPGRGVLSRRTGTASIASSRAASAVIAPGVQGFADRLDPRPRHRRRRTRYPAGEPDAGLGGLPPGRTRCPFRISLAGIGEVTGELHADRAEVLINAMHVILVHHPRARPNDPRIGRPSGSRRFLVRNTVCFSCAPPMYSTPSARPAARIAARYPA